MDAERFEELVRMAVEDLPPEIAERMSNVGIEVRPYPERSHLGAAVVPPGSTLLGLYVGVPLTKRGAWYNMTLPDRILIFQRPIESVCRTEGEVIERVREVVVHEIGHHFGLSDARLREIEAEHRARRSA